MAEIDRSAVEGAVRKRSQYILDNIQTLSLKQCRKLLEEDLGLPEKGLNAYKGIVQELVEEIVLSGSSKVPAVEAGGPEKGAAATKAKGKEIRKSSQAERGPSSKSKRKGASADDEGHQPKRRQKKAQKEEKSRKRAAASEEDAEDGDSAGSSDDEPTKRKAKKTKAAPKPAGKSERSAAVQKLQGILRKATISIPPALYVKHKSDADLEEALEDLLAKHGLHRSADPRQIERVKKKVQLNRDLEGIDPSNILEDIGRGARRAATRGVNYAAVLAGPKLELEDEEDEDEDEEEDDDEEDEDEDNEEEVSDAGDNDDADQESDKEESDDGVDDDDDDDDDDRGSEDEVKRKKVTKTAPKAKLKASKGPGGKGSAEKSSAKSKSKEQKSSVQIDSEDDDDGSPKIKHPRKTLQAWSDDDE
eukprot:jgi/Botrbrau1/4853/Bobra.0032s0014.1